MVGRAPPHHIPTSLSLSLWTLGESIKGTNLTLCSLWAQIKCTLYKTMNDLRSFMLAGWGSHLFSAHMEPQNGHKRIIRQEIGVSYAFDDLGDRKSRTIIDQESV